MRDAWQMPRTAATPRRVIRFTRCVLAALALTAVVGAPASAAITATPAAAAASVGLRLVDVPAADQNDPRAHVYIVDHLAPGTVIDRRIEVSNTTASAVHVVMYSAAATIARGSFVGSAGHTPDDLSTWTAVRPSVSDIAADGRLTATVTIAVPRDAAPGEQYGVVWAEARSAPVGGVGITQVNRVGIRLYLSVGAGGPPAANFTIESLTAARAANGRPTVIAAAHNTGGRALDLNGTLQLLAGPGGLRAGPFPATLGVTLAIGDTEPITIALDNQLPAGPWNAQITLHSGLLERTAQATVTFPDAGISPPVNTTPSRPGWPHAAVAGVAALLLGSGTLLIVLRRRRITVA
jgi:hypothetical protein